jgi:hypothetical protein
VASRFPSTSFTGAQLWQPCSIFKHTQISTRYRPLFAPKIKSTVNASQTPSLTRSGANPHTLRQGHLHVGRSNGPGPAIILTNDVGCKLDPQRLCMKNERRSRGLSMPGFGSCSGPWSVHGYLRALTAHVQCTRLRVSTVLYHEREYRLVERV